MIWGGILLAVAAAVFDVACLCSVLTNPNRYRNANQLIWVLVVLLAGPVGGVLYLVLGRAPRPTEPVPPRAERSYAIRHPFDS